MGGLDSPKFVEFKSLLFQGFRDVRKHAERIIMIVELMQKGASCRETRVGNRSDLALAHH